MKTSYYWRLCWFNHKSRIEVTMVNGRLHHKYGNTSTYILLSQDAVLSKTTKMFGQTIHVVGRTCRIHKSVNATSSPSADALFEDFSFQFEGNIMITETCPFNKTWKFFKWTFSSSAKLRLPVVCSLKSTQINCDSVTLRSSQTKAIHLTHYRMQVIEEKVEEEKVSINKTVFIRSEISSEPHFTSTTSTLLDLLKSEQEQLSS